MVAKIIVSQANFAGTCVAVALGMLEVLGATYS